MEHGLLEDRLLLQRFVKDNSQEAFAALTARYLNLVYAACRRELADADTAEDVTQAVFLILARKAPRLGRNVVLSGWLFQTARFAAKNAWLREERRRRYEEKAMERHPQARTEDAEWSDIEPLLNKSLAALKGKDRDSILLRFFQDASFAEVGASLGLSEEAARKRVTRALGKLKHFFGKEEVYLPSSTLASLLTAHAVQIAPAACQTGVTKLTASIVAGHASAALAGSSAYQLTEGVLKAMKIAKLKLLTSSIAVVALGGAVSYGMLHGQAPDQKTAYRTVILMGKARYADGTPASGVRLSAQVQDASYESILRAKNPRPSAQKVREINKNMTWTKPDGTYALAIGADLRYNVMLLPNNLVHVGEDDGWVAAAAESVSGHKNQKIAVPDLVLERGGFVTGTVSDANGNPMRDTYVGNYGPARPSTGAESTYAITDTGGRYRLRVAPGRNQVYVSDRQDGASLSVDAGQTKVMDFQALPVLATTSQPQLVHFQALPK